MKIGYARVSTDDQNLDRQLDQLKTSGCKKVYYEKITGTKKDRPELNKLLEDIRESDTIIVAELARLGRSTKDLIALSELIKLKGAELVSLKENLDTTTATGKAMFGMLTVMAQFERDIISERTMQGLASAKARGRSGGRPNKKNDKSKAVETLYQSGFKIKDISDQTGLSRATIYRILNKNSNMITQELSPEPIQKAIEKVTEQLKGGIVVKSKDEVIKATEKLKENKGIKTFFKN